MLLFLIKKEISQNEDITLWSQKKNFEFLFADEKNLKGEQIDNKSKNKRKTVFTNFFFVSDHAEAANIIRKNIRSNRTVL